MKLKQLMTFDNMQGLLNICSSVSKSLHGNSFTLGRWYDGVQSEGDETMFNFTGMSTEERRVLDNFLKIKIGNSDVISYFDMTDKTDEEKRAIYDDISTCFCARASMLDRLYYSNLLQYNPIDNYDRTETQTHEEENTIGARSSSIITGARSSSNIKGSRTDTSTDTEKVSPFDSTEYSKSRSKNVNELVSGQQTDTMSSQAATDTTSSQQAVDSNEGGYTLRARGNIGTMTTGYMLDEFRKNALFIFADEIIKIIEQDITCMIY